MILKDKDIKDKCYGCYACANACPKKCITLPEDREGFRYPQVNESICNNCGLCVNACPIGRSAKELHADLLDEPDVYACYILDEEARKRSASGGMGFAISKYVILQGGVVFGAIGKAIGHVHHTMAHTIDGVYPMCGSKYAQSDIAETYIQAQKKLRSGCPVLYTGTPCQIAGLYAYLKIRYDNLITCDLICHGVPSQKVLNTYIKETEIKHGKSVIEFKRSKMNKYSPPQYIVEFDDGSNEYIEKEKSYYRQGFLSNLFQRKSCYICEYAKIPRVSDFSLGDIFFDDVILMRLDPEKKMGASLIIVNTDKARKIVHEISGLIFKEKLNSEVLKNVGHVNHPPIYNKKRYKFFKCFYKNGFEKAFIKHGKQKFIMKIIVVILHRLRLYNFVKSLIGKRG